MPPWVLVKEVLQEGPYEKSPQRHPELAFFSFLGLAVSTVGGRPGCKKSNPLFGTPPPSMTGVLNGQSDHQPLILDACQAHTQKKTLAASDEGVHVLWSAAAELEVVYVPNGWWAWGGVPDNTPSGLTGNSRMMELCPAAVCAACDVSSCRHRCCCSCGQDGWATQPPPIDWCVP